MKTPRRTRKNRKPRPAAPHPPFDFGAYIRAAAERETDPAVKRWALRLADAYNDPK
jgi:hypothetical protein